MSYREELERIDLTALLQSVRRAAREGIPWERLMETNPLAARWAGVVRPTYLRACNVSAAK